jgi:hypothetical protein
MVGTAFAEAVLACLQMPGVFLPVQQATRLDVLVHRVEKRSGKPPFYLRISVSNAMLAVADAIQSI